jgi:Holliday junction resolvasome RuvABC endonuclease subunit
VIVLAFDPGMTTGYAAVRSPGDQLAVLGSDRTETRDEILGLARDLIKRVEPEVVLVEAIDGYNHGDTAGAKLMHLTRAADFAGSVIGLCAGLGVRCVGVSARTWRRTIVGQTSPTNAEIAVALSTILRRNGLDKTNNHERDGLGLALYGARVPGALLDKST